ncbi:DUF2934 domain-containing protein [Methylobacterium sp. Leaf117]|uniref:DUF2934 domain-containing protein n=1 Tax=Methylobacterium sp. Leaf117 TaxID=1736260 RepID=UPI0006FD274A|nr:DUF2934 domain-containing protein [Methylobacterium sp. Leaf117]KQP77497.1 hypothetical protein ASF57_19550 [Methylobacterium sp. Leaf117]
MRPETMPTEAEIRGRALELWETRGRPEGYEEEFWLQAERQLRGETTGQPVLPDGDFVTSGTGSDCCR